MKRWVTLDCHAWLLTQTHVKTERLPVVIFIILRIFTHLMLYFIIEFKSAFGKDI